MRWLDRLARRAPPEVEAAAPMATANAAAGLRVACDPAATARGWRRSAAVGDADGQATLAYVFGAGVRRDPVAAPAWPAGAQAGRSALAAPSLAAARGAREPAGIAQAGWRTASSDAVAEAGA